MDTRYNYELAESKSILEKNLGKKVEYLCWPGGGYNEITAKLGTNIYKSVVLCSSDQPEKKNVYGADPVWMRRAGGPFISSGNSFEKIKVLGGWSLYLTLKSLQGSAVHDFLRKVLKAIHIFMFKYLT